MATYRPDTRITVTSGQNPRDISSDVISVTTDKTYGSPEGTFNVVLAPSQKYEELFNPNDRITIECDGGSGSGFSVVMTGLLSQIEKTFTIVGDGKPVRRVVVTGSDMGKVLSQHHCQWYAAPRQENIGTESSITALVYGAKLYSGGTPAQLAALILEKELHDRLPWTKQFIVGDLIQTPDRWTLNNAGISMHSTVLEALRYVANEPYNKLHGDTSTDGKYHVILEKCPFDNTTGRLERQTLKTIAPEMVVASNLGKNDHDRITYMWLKTLVGAFGEPGGNNLLMLKGDAQQYHTPSVEAHGFRPWFPECRFSPFTKSETPNLVGGLDVISRPVKDRTDAFWNWYRDNHKYLSGNITLHGSPDIRTGDGVVFDGNEYFVERVNHQMQFDPAPRYLTTLHVTRGQKSITR
jgi:hypothetical protein